MAFFTPSCLISEIRGSVGNQTFSRNAHGNIVKEKLVQTVTNTAKQIETRGVMADAVIAWQGLDDSERREWQQFAKLFPRKNSLGKQYILSGYGLFVSCYLNKINTGNLGNPLPVQPPPFPVVYEIEVFQSTGNFNTRFRSERINPGFEHSWYVAPQHLGQLKSFNPSTLRHWISQEVVASRSVPTYNVYFTVFGSFPTLTSSYTFLQGYRTVHVESGISSKMYFFGFNQLFDGLINPKILH